MTLMAAALIALSTGASQFSYAAPSTDACALVTPAQIGAVLGVNTGIQEELAPGIGDQAHHMTTPGFGAGLSVRNGDFVFKVRVYGFPIEQVKAKEKTGVEYPRERQAVTLRHSRAVGS